MGISSQSLSHSFSVPFLALPVMFFGLFNIMDFALYSFPIFFFCIMGHRQDKRVKDALRDCHRPNCISDSDDFCSVC